MRLLMFRHPRRSRSPQRPRKLTDEERLANAVAKVASLQAKVTALRAANRDALIENLFRKFGIEEINGDLSETKRLAALQASIAEKAGA